MTRYARTDFAGPGGADLGLELLGLTDIVNVGVEIDPWACYTARSAGLTRWEADVTSDAVRGYPWFEMWLYLSSPECQTFSTAGKGEGRKHIASYIAALHLVAAGATPQEAVAAVNDQALGISAVLSLEPMLVIRDHRPANIAFEQVPAVLPLWEAYCEVLRGWGYSAWCGNLTSEMYGVPQTRRRAILMASLEREVSAPVATHSRYYSRTPEKLDEGVAKWVSMAEALQLGNEVYMRSNYGTGGDPAARGERPAPAPAPAITTKIGRNMWFAGAGATSEQTGGQRPRKLDQPAHTILGKGTATWLTHPEGGAALQRPVGHAVRRGVAREAPGDSGSGEGDCPEPRSYREPLQRVDEVSQRRRPRHRAGGWHPAGLPRRLPVAGHPHAAVPAGRQRLPEPHGSRGVRSSAGHPFRPSPGGGDVDDGGWSLRNNTSDHAAVRSMSHPAPTMYFGRRLNKMVWEQA